MSSYINAQVPSQRQQHQRSRRSSAQHTVEDIQQQKEAEEVERLLRQFDLESNYGPCAGITRMQRWERANKLGLNPPQQVKELLLASPRHQQCLWHGRL